MRLQGGIRVRNLDKQRDIGDFLSEEGSWLTLFRLADERYDYLGPDLRRFHRAVELTVDVEHSLWSLSVYPYRRVRTHREDQQEFIVIEECEQDDRDAGALPKRQSMVTAASQLLDRDAAFFDLSRFSSPTHYYSNQRRWTYHQIDEHGYLHLKRAIRPDNAEAPARGYLRPSGLVGNASLYRRRTEVLDSLKDDAFLLRALTDRSDRDSDYGRGGLKLFNPRLDSSKKALVQRILRQRPLFCVQGPPGTGKTTLATEVIMQTLCDNPSARILVTSQAHNPLDNLLERVENALAKQSGDRFDGRSVLSVRLLPEERLAQDRYEESSRRLWSKYNASKQADKMLTRGQRARPQPGQQVVQGKTHYERLRALVDEQQQQGNSASLAARVVHSANIVYATINDRQLHELTGQFFDLVIVEEAARAYPIEILAVMRHARRWLLIGDQQQLPPFAIRDFEHVLRYRLEQYQRRRRTVGNRGISSESPRSVLAERGDSTPLREELLGYSRPEETVADALHWLRFFGKLYDDGHAKDEVHKDGTRVGRGSSGPLEVQWRMHPSIGTLMRETFYSFLENGDEGKMSSKLAHDLEIPSADPGRTMIWLDVPYIEHEELARDYSGFGGGFENGYEARVLLGFLRELRSRRSRLSFAVLSPYRAQVEALKGLLGRYEFNAPLLNGIEDRVFTVDSFQGREADVVMLSLVRNNDSLLERPGLGFLSERTRQTVMFSRAERLLVVAGSRQHFRKFADSGINLAREYIEAHPLGQMIRAERFIGAKERDKLVIRLERWKGRHPDAARRKNSSQEVE